MSKADARRDLVGDVVLTAGGGRVVVAGRVAAMIGELVALRAAIERVERGHVRLDFRGRRVVASLTEERQVVHLGGEEGSNAGGVDRAPAEG